LEWRHRTSDDPERGASFERLADAGERARLAAALGLPALDRFELSYRLAPSGGGRYHLSGSLTASVEQACIVTGESLRSQIEETIEEAFWPPEQLDRAVSEQGGEEVGALEAAVAEPIADGMLDVGRLAYELLATAIDPYPRKADAVLEAPSDASEAPRNNPFSVLKTLGGSRGSNEG
ncbi:MAG: hypothetical protein AB7L18_08760, partial [Hyphomicrobiaceae bacterium]